MIWEADNVTHRMPLISRALLAKRCPQGPYAHIRRVTTNAGGVLVRNSTLQKKHTDVAICYRAAQSLTTRKRDGRRGILRYLSVLAGTIAPVGLDKRVIA